MSEAHAADFVSLRQLTLAYGATIAVPSLDLDIKKGELITLLGPSGCGKTTTMRAIAGLIQPSAGTIYIDGNDMTRVTANKRQVGLVFQSYALFPHLSAFENVAFGLRLKKVSNSEISARVDEGLERVGLLHLAQRKPAELSGGQQQRLALARSLVMQPKVLLLDEPLSNLDARLRLEMRTELQRLQRETGVTMVFVTHDQSEALALADRIVLMSEGRIAQLSTAEELYKEPETVFAADFVGFENIFKVVESTDGNCTIAKRETAANSGSNDASVTEHLQIKGQSNANYLAWRPHSISVGHGVYPAQIAGVAFAGENREYTLQTAIGMVKAVSPADGPIYAIGDNITFDIPLSAARALTQ